MNPEQEWPSEWLRGVLSVCTLRILRDGPTYGYAIATRLTEAGLGAVKGGTLYPLLGRLEQSGWVEVEWRPGEGGPGRKFYALTPEGHAEAERQAHRWAEFTDITRALTDQRVSLTNQAVSKGQQRP
ncbi:PadR family transcriptional regulator [Ornithinimicrobium faecis]|uniref:PadR family transcriptional regulator n=1 Tax=Ornithinimicrobium faecis TaxID=2934158 RepID=UPI002117CA44|nr:PadR family transcriptional regulator [Ornithinimicrobium sp. HY1745]